MLKNGIKWGRSVALVAVAVLAPLSLKASEAEKAVVRKYVAAAPARIGMTDAEVERDSVGCVSCHTDSDAKTMHVSQAVKLGCASCHGGDAGVIAPGGTPRSAVDRLNGEMVKFLNSPEARTRLLAMGMEPIANTPDQMAAHLTAELAKWARVAKLAKLSQRSVF